jgi:hypothetical protein
VHDDPRIDLLIAGIVRDAQIDTDRERDELRLELESHFAECDSPAALQRAIERFGDPIHVSTALATAHRGNRVLAHIGRILCACTASTAIALMLQLVTNLRRDARSQALEISPAFLRSVGFSAFIIVMLVAAWELDIQPLCARLERHPARLLAAIGGLAATMVLFHALYEASLPLLTALVASAVDVAIWACTIAILSRLDQRFARTFTSVP